MLFRILVSHLRVGVRSARRNFTRHEIYSACTQTRTGKSIAGKRAALWPKFFVVAFLLLASVLQLSPVRAASPIPPAGVCADFPPNASPGTTPTFAGLWVNPNQPGTGWSITYQDVEYDAGESAIAFTWFTYDKQGQPVWFSSELKPVGDDGHEIYYLHKYRAPPAPGTGAMIPVLDGVETDPPVKLGVRLTSDPTRLAISWQWDIYDVGGVDTWHHECIGDLSRIGPYFGDPFLSIGYQPNAATSGLWWEPELPFWGVAWNILQVPSAMYQEWAHVTLFDNNGRPRWVYGRQDQPSTELPAVSKSLDLIYRERKPGLRDMTLYCSESAPTLCCDNAGSCFEDTTVGTFSRKSISATSLDVKINLNAGETQKFDRPASWYPVGLRNPAVTPGYVGLKKITAVNQISVDRAVCIVPTGQATCDITVNWSADAQGESWEEFRVLREFPVSANNQDRTVAFLGLSASPPNPGLSTQLSGQFTDKLAAGQSARYILVSDYENDNSYDLWERSTLYQTIEVRAVMADDPPIVAFNQPMEWNPVTQEGMTYPQNKPLVIVASATAASGIEGFEFAIGDTEQTRVSVCGTNNAYCLVPVDPNMTPPTYAWSWPGAPAGEYTWWARAKAKNPDSAPSGWISRRIKLDIPAAVQVNAGGRVSFGRLEAVPLEAITSGGAPVAKVEFFAEPQFGANRNPFSIGAVTTPSAPGRYTLNWTSHPPGPYAIKAWVTAGDLEPYPSAPLSITINSDLPSVSIAMAGCGVLNGCTREMGPPHQTLTIVLANPDWFADVKYRVTKGSTTSNVPVCTTACSLTQEKAWAPTAGTYQVSAYGTLRDGASAVSTVHTVTIAERLPRKTTLDLVLENGTTDPATRVAMLNADTENALTLAREISHPDEAFCSYILKSQSIPPLGSHTPTSYCQLLRSVALPVGRCQDTLCEEITPVDVSRHVLCPAGSDGSSGCAGTHSLVAATLYEHDARVTSTAFDVDVPGAQFVGQQNVPPMMVTGTTSAQINVSFKNTGSKPWAAGTYRLRNVGDDWGSGVGTVALAAATPAGGTAMFTFSIVAPTVAETRLFQWRMEGPVGAFGDKSEARQINVAEPEDPNPLAKVAEPLLAPPVATPSHAENLVPMAGNAGVSGGAATYDIPIVVPPGRRGMQPSISLGYNSRNGNGIVGMGWTLQAGSSIHLCPRTIAQDGYIQAVKLDASDALCLDGQRLVLDPASTKSAYGEDGAYYRTEVDSMQRIIQSGGNLGSGSERFEVTARDGGIAVYGRESLTKPLVAAEPLVKPVPVAGGEQRVLSWLLSYRRDTVGNGMHFEYQADSGGNGETLLAFIKYTSWNGEAIGSTEQRKVAFEYEKRPDPSSSYLSGYRSSQTQRLKTIRTYVGSALVRDYTLTYQVSAASERSLLKEIQECATGPNGRVCRNPTSFAWHDGAPTYNLKADAQINSAAGGLHEYVGNFGNSVRLYAAADYDGNGARDILWRGPVDDSDLAPLATRLLTLSPDRQLVGVVNVTGLIPSGAMDPGPYVDYRGRADFDLDGRPDLLGLQNGELTINFWRATSTPAPTADTPFQNVYTERWRTGIPVARLSDVHYVGDVDGGGVPEIVVASGPGCSGVRNVKVYRYIPSGLQPADVYDGVVLVKQRAFSQLGNTLNLQSTCEGSGTSQFWYGQKLERVADFNGDGLVDYWIRDTRNLNNGRGAGRSIALASRATTNGYAIGTPLAMSALAVDGQTSAAEDHRDLAAFWMDVNGDGLDDWLYPKAMWVNEASQEPAGGGPAVLRGRWTLRLNVGGKWAAAQVFTEAAGGTGIESCGPAPNDVNCEQAWNPWRAGSFRQMDTDADGRLELLVPTSYAARMCTFAPEASDGSECSSVAQKSLLPKDVGSSATCGTYPNEQNLLEPVPLADECRAVYYCPELMQAPNIGAIERLGHGAGFVAARDECGNVDLNPSPSRGWNVDEFRGLYVMGGGTVLDHSSYNLTALRFVDDPSKPSGIALEVRATGMVAGQSSLEAGEDLYGDGLADLITKVSCYGYFGSNGGGRRACGIPLTYGVFNVSANSYQVEGAFQELPTSPTLAGGIPFATPAVLVNENRGAAIPPGAVPDAPDMLWMVTDGIGRETMWTYDPLGSKAGRIENDIPLYELTPDRVQDASHINFTSSMHVVSQMSVSDGVTLHSHRTYQYGYADALYNVNGRGFQGFRMVAEEDVAAGTRTKTYFKQVFPFTGKPERVVTSGLSSVRSERRISEEASTWGCVAEGAGTVTASCGTGRLFRPHLSRRVTKTYEIALQGLTQPAQISEMWDVAAVPTSVAGACTTGGFPGNVPPAIDEYGNVTDRTVLVWDTGTAANLKMSCERTQSSFTKTPAAWVIDQLDDVTVTKSIEYASGHDAGAPSINSDQKIQRRDYHWTGQRLLDYEIFEEGHPDRQVTTDYGYNEYGLPISVATRFLDQGYLVSGADATGLSAERTTSTGYDDSGYFPDEVTNALSQKQSMVVRASDGQVSSSTDANGTVTTYDYDAFGMPIKTSYSPKGGMTLAHPLMVGLAAPVGCPAGSAWMRVQDQRGGIKETTCFDLLGRPRRTFSEALGGETVKQDADYDARGLVLKTRGPYTDTTAGPVTEFKPYSPGAGAAYDVLGRPFVKETTKPGGVLLTRYDYVGHRTNIQVRNSAVTPNTTTRTCSTDAPRLDSAGVTHLSLQRIQDSLGRYVKTVDANACTNRFWHDALGNVAQIEDAKGNRTRATYNVAGHRTSVNDPNQGYWTFVYNPIGELRKQVDARQAVDTVNRPSTRWFYDALGRTVERIADRNDVDGSGNTNRTTHDLFVWDAPNAKGQLLSQTREYRTPGTAAVQFQERWESYGYDVFARRIASSVSQRDGAGATVSLGMGWDYDLANGRLLSQKWNEDEGLWFIYDAQGRHVETRDGRHADRVYWKATRADAWGNISRARLGQQIDLERDAVPQTGQVSKIRYLQNGASLQRFDYAYDLYGNVVSQALNQTLTTETFAYDILHRLVRTERSGGATGVLTYSYERDGNIKRKVDYGSGNYVYGSAPNSAAPGYAGPNAVRSVPFGSNTRTMSYDLNGNLIGASGGDAGMEAFTAVYDAANLPVRTQLGSATLQFGYGPDGKRGRQWGAQRRIYMEEYELTPVDSKYYIGDYALITRSAAGRRLEYLATDRLGSVSGILRVNSQGAAAIHEARGFDAFGKPRDGVWNSALDDALPSDPATPRGFTSHEHLDRVKLIHMNGRAFDYGLGRFLSVDPLIQFPLNSQGLNPYSYIMNNPLSATDPTGYAQSCGTTIADGEVCEVEVSKKVKEVGSRIAKTVTTTVTLANNDGVIHGAVGSGAAAYRAIDASIAGSPSTREGGPSVGPTPKRVVEDLTISCVRFGSCSNNPARLSDGGDAPPLLAALGEIHAAFSAPEADGIRHNTITGERLQDPVATRTNTVLGVVTFIVPAPKLGLPMARVHVNQSAGNAFRDMIADLLRKEGLDVATEVYKKTPFGKRYIDIEVSRNGKILGGIETKLGKSPYKPAQRAKDEWLRMNGYNVDLIRGP